MQNKKLTALAVLGALGAPALSLAAEHDVQVYGKVHLSVDAYQNSRVSNDTSTPPKDSGVGISSNSSRLGFKGSHEMENLPTLIWQYESQIDVDDGEGSLANRNTFLGFKGGWGKVIAGNHDTPMKRAVTKWDPFNETVGEGRTVFGQPGGSGTTDYNVRAKNSIMYWSPSLAGFKIVAQYSADTNAGDEGDNNDFTLWDIGFEFKTKDKKWQAWGAYENQDGFGPTGDESASGWRLSGLGNFGPVGVGVLVEQTDDPDPAVGKRDGAGVWVKGKLGPRWSLGASYYWVDDFKEVADTGAAVPSVFVGFKMDKATKAYLMYSMLDQSAAADYRLGRRGHGDRYRAISGSEDDPAALSLGLIYKF